jgi:WD40 repeat protein
VRLWDPRTGSETARLEGTGAVSALAVLPDADGKGCRLALGARDRTVRLWDVQNASELCRLEVDAFVYCLERPAPSGRPLMLV